MTMPLVQADGDKQPFYSRIEYVLGYIALSVSSDEVTLLAKAILELLGHNHEFPSPMLDIGPADGRLTEKLVPPEVEISIFEPNPIFYSLAVSRLSASHVITTAIAQEFKGEFEGLSRKFGFVLASHVLYHVLPAIWAEYLRAIAHQLTPGGKCAVVLWDEHSEARRLVHQINPNRWLCSSLNFETLRLSNFVSTGLEIIGEKRVSPIIRPHSEEAARLIVDFLCGSSRVEEEKSRERLEHLLVTHGLENSQTVYLLERLEH